MDQFSTVEDALRQAERLLDLQPTLAAEQARLILEAVPEHPRALMVLGAALARMVELDGAYAVLNPLAAAQPKVARVHAEYGALLAALGQTEAAIASLRHAIALNPDLPQAWRGLGDVLLVAGRSREADAAYAQHLRASVHDPALMAPATALCEGDLPTAERLLRDHLKRMPTDVAAIRMLAELGTRLGRYREAEQLLARCLELAPGFVGARHNYAVVLYRQNRGAEAIPHLERLIATEPHQPDYSNLLAATLAGIGDYDRAIELYAGLTKVLPRQARLWLSYGHALRTSGRHGDAVSAYRTCLRLMPHFGDAWWSLANLKTAVLDDRDLASMQGALQAEDLSAEDRFHLHYALGRVHEEAGRHAESFASYAKGAALRRVAITYDGASLTAQIDRCIALYTPAFLAARRGLGCPDPAPIFVVGLPRSGSTLIEQMLASHSLVEGTMELPEIAGIVKALSEESSYPGCVGMLRPADLADWGQRYLDRARIYRKTGRPFFIDKLPNNWLHVGLIRLMLPNAKLIDARRHPMATCFSAFKQHFAQGQNYSYDLGELGRFYRDYLAMMAHMDAVAPGAVHRVQYEAMVDDTEAELGRLLEYCGLDFEPACLRFHENTRAVRTASSEQVRRPIFREGLDQWRHYQPWLGPLEEALGDAVPPPG